MTEAAIARGDQSGVPGVPYEDYHLTPEQMDQREAEIVDLTKQLSGIDSGIAVLLVQGSDPTADFGRSSETLAFAGQEDYDFHAGMAKYEQRSEFLFTVDLDSGKVAHVKRLVSPLSPEQQAETGLTGIEPIDDRLTADDPAERLDLKTILDRTQSIGDVSKSFNVATNQVTKRADKNPMYAVNSYKAIFEIGIQRGLDSVFAYMNNQALSSLAERLGVEYYHIADGDYHLPIVRNNNQDSVVTEYDQNYIAVCIPDSQTNHDAFNKPDPEFPMREFVAAKPVVLVQR